MVSPTADTPTRDADARVRAERGSCKKRGDSMENDRPAAGVFTMDDPRSPGRHRCDLVGFYYPGRDTLVDHLCGARFLGNFWSCELCFSPPGHEARPFQNAEAAFQACKFWSCAHEFSSLSGEEAFRKKKQLGAPDFTYGGYGSNWRAMRAVLETKFSRGSELAGLLLGTGAAFLLEHNEVRRLEAHRIESDRAVCPAPLHATLVRVW